MDQIINDYSSNTVNLKEPKVEHKGYGKKFSHKTQTPLEMKEQEITIDMVAGNVKTTTLMVFQNNTDSTLEGELKFNLKEGSSVCSYGIDVDGKIIDAVPVTKEKARVVFEQEVRERSTKQVSIVENVKGNVFKTRLYPMYPKQPRKVKIQTIDEMITKVHGKKKIQMHFQPIQRPKTLTSMKLNIHIEKIDGIQTRIYMKDMSGKLHPLNMQEASMSMKEIDETLATSKDGELAGILMMTATEKDDQHRVTLEENNHFAVTFKLPEDREGTSMAQKEKVNIALLLDQSHSRRMENLKSEMDIVEQLFKTYNQVTLNVMPFNHQCQSTKIVKTFEDYKLFYETIEFDGGSDLYKAIQTLNDDKTAFDFALVFTDGFTSVGKDPFTINPKIQLYLMSAQANQETSLLKYLASKSGGRYVPLSQLKKPESIVKEFGNQLFSLLEVNYDTSMVSCYPNLPEPISLQQDTFTVYGKRSNDQEAKITIKVGAGQQTTCLTATVPKDANSTTSMVHALYAQRKIGELAMSGEQFEKEMLETGQEYAMTTPNTSLIVLETLDQYEKYNIRPPHSLANLQQQYDDKLFAVELKNEQRFNDKVDEYTKKFRKERYTDWYEKTFTDKPKLIMKFDDDSDCDEEENFCAAAPSSLLEDSCSSSDSSSDMDLGMLQKRDSNDEGNFSLHSNDEEIEKEEEKKEEVKEDLFSAKEKECSEAFFDAPPDAKKKKRKKNTKKNTSSETPQRSSIFIQPYKSNATYIQTLNDSKTPKTTYYELKSEYYSSPSFYLEVANFFFEKKDTKMGVCVLLNICELEIDDPELIRIVGYRLFQAKEYAYAEQLFRKVLSIRQESPQSFRDLALVLEQQGQYEEAAKQMYQVIGRRWDDRFSEIEYTAILELNHIFFAAAQAKQPLDWNNLGISPSAKFDMPMDLRVSMSWSADMVDVDLHVLEPSKENCYYAHNLTQIGGKLSRDFTRGCGPEEYMLRKGYKGEYIVSAKYYSNHQQSLTGGTTVLLTFYKDYCKENEERQLMTINLDQTSEKMCVCKIDI